MGVPMVIARFDTILICNQSDWLQLEHISDTENLADMLTKPLVLYIESMLLWNGDTVDASMLPQVVGSWNQRGVS